IVSFLPLVGLILLRRLLDQVVTKWTSPEIESNAILATIGWLAVVSILTLTLRSLTSTVGELQGLEVADYMKTILHSKSIEMDLEFYENTQYHDTLRRAQQEAPYRPVRIVNSLLQVTQSGLSLLVIGVFLMFTLHWAFFVV